MISRVTGGTRSEIDGTLRSTIPGADFFFVNPAGVVFGPNASLDVQGSFHVSTADELRFSDGAVFSATNPDASSLTVAAPEAFGFLGAQLAAITVDRSTLEVDEGETISVVGGDILMDGANNRGVVRAKGGTILLLGLASPGQARLDTGRVTAQTLGQIELLRLAIVDASGDGAGLIRIRGGEIVVDDQSFVFAANTGRRDAAAGRGVVIEAGSLTVTSGSVVTAAAPGEGDAGAVTINATRLVEVREGSRISSSTSAQANAGKVTVTAERVLVDGDRSGINSQANTGSSGHAGAVTIDATGLVEVREGSQISSSTFAQGNAGKVTVTAERVLVDGDGVLASIGSQADRNSSGSAGAVTIDATGLVEVREGGQISSNTFGAGDAGEVTVEAGRVLVDAQDFGEGGSSLFSTSIGAQAGGRASDISEPRGEDLGNAGRVTINASERVDVRNGGVITSLSVGRDAGEVTVTAPVVLIDGAGSTFFTRHQQRSATRQHRQRRNRDRQRPGGTGDSQQRRKSQPWREQHLQQHRRGG